MKRKTLLCLVTTAFLFLCAFTTFRDEQGKGTANVVSVKTPTDTTLSGTIWTRSFSSGKKTSYNSTPILTETAIYIVNSDTLYEVAYEDGRILRQCSLCAKMNSICNMLLNESYLYIPLNDGKMECIDIQSMTSIWQSKSFGGQSLSTVFLHDGYLYAGSTIINNSKTSGIFYCLNAADGSVKWTYENNEYPGGYYWSGGIVYDDALYFCGDNGLLISHALYEDKVYDTYQLTDSAQIRSGITYSSETNALYTAANDGTLYEIQAAGGKIDTVRSSSLVPDALQINCTSTPTIYNKRIYIGCSANHYAYVVVLDTDSLQPIYKVQGPAMAEVKSSPLVSAGWDPTGNVYIYFSANALPGGLYYFTDHPNANNSAWKTLYTPTGQKQYCLSSITAGSDGTLYYSNDSGTLFAVRELSNKTISTPDTQKKPETKVTSKTKKPGKPYKIKTKKKKKKILLQWKKKTQKSQTEVFYRYNSGKWKKKIIKSKNSCSIMRKKGKKLSLRLRCRKKINNKWAYSGRTKIFHLKM